MIPFFILPILLFSIYFFSSNIFLIYLIHIATLFFLSIFNELYFLITYFSYLLCYKFFIPYLGIDSLLELLPVFLNCTLIIPVILKSKNIKIYKKGFIYNILFPILLILISQFLAFLINQSNTFELFRWYLWLLNLFPLFLYVYYLDKNIIALLVEDIKKVLIFFFFIQVFVVLMQSNNTFLNYSTNPDTFSGTFGPAGTAFLSFFCCLLFYPLAYMSLKKREFSQLIFLSILIVLLTIISDIVFTLIVCMLFPLFMFVYKNFLELSFGKNFIKNTTIVSFIVLILFSSSRISSIFNLLDSQQTVFNSNRLNIEELTYYSNMITSNEDGLKFGRTLGLVYSFNKIITSDLINQLFGYGPGSTRSEQSVVQRSGPPKIRPIPHTNFFGVDKIILEFGILGLIAFISLFLKIYRFTLNSKSKSENIKIFLMILFLYFIYGLVYDGGWLFNPSKNGIFWIITAIIFSLLDQENFEKNHIYNTEKN